MKEKKPNILLIVTDQLRADCLGCYDGYPVRTPHIDALAAEGMVFERAYTPLPTCCPARQSMISAQRPERHQGLWNYPAGGTGWLHASPDFWPGQLKSMGYRMAYLGKWHVSPKETPLDFGYERYVDQQEYVKYREAAYGPVAPANGWFGEVDQAPLEAAKTHWLASLACAQIEEYAKEEAPWHIRLDFEEPHLPCLPCEEFYRQYEGMEIPKWSGFEETFEKKPYIQKQQLYSWGVEGWSWKEWQEVVRRYYAVISQIDDAVGRVLGTLKRCGQQENTLILFTADHGDMCGSHRMMDKHYIMYEDVVHVPMIAIWTGRIQAGTRNEDFVYQALDLAPTLMDITGGEPNATDGRSLLPLMRGETPADWRQAVVSTYNGQQFGLYTQRMLRTRDWKYVWNTTDVDELYDLNADVGELHNRIYDPACQEMVKAFRRELLAVLLREGDFLVSQSWMRDQLLGRTQKL